MTTDTQTQIAVACGSATARPTSGACAFPDAGALVISLEGNMLAASTPRRPALWLTVCGCGRAITVQDYELQGSPTREWPDGYYQIQCPGCRSHVSVPSKRVRLVTTDAYGLGQLLLGATES